MTPCDWPGRGAIQGDAGGDFADVADASRHYSFCQEHAWEFIRRFVNAAEEARRNQGSD